MKRQTILLGAAILVAVACELWAGSVPYACRDDLIEIMFAGESRVRLRGGEPIDLASSGPERATAGLAQVLAGVGDHAWHRGCEGVAETKLDAIQQRGIANTGKPLYNLNNIYRLEIAKGQDVWEISKTLEALPGIMLARPVPEPMPLPLPPDYGGMQGYLNAVSNNPSGVGINAGYAWTQPGGTGAGITVCDMEYSWNTNHIDISKAPNSQINANNVADPFNTNSHGTAVIGMLSSDPNGWGTTGICHGAGLETCGTYYGAPSWNVPGAIAIAISSLSTGDVVLLEQQWAYTGATYIPIEWWLNYSPSPQTSNGVYVAIQNAVANGIHVVEAAGNGYHDLDTLTWIGDSGAIVVGAGSPPTLQRLAFSDYGNRVNLHGWGGYVVTTGYGDLYTAEGTNAWYTGRFSGTSSASPMIAGALACLEGYWMARWGVHCPPLLARHILMTTGTPQVTPPVGHIGPRPDLMAAFAADSDGDGPPDGWEVAYGLNPTNAADAVIDSDGDGAINRAEHAADTNPQDSNSVFRVVTLTNDANWHVVFNSVTSRVYEVRYSTNLLSTNWSVLVSNIVGSGSTSSATDTNAGDGRYYRAGTRGP